MHEPCNLSGQYIAARTLKSVGVHLGVCGPSEHLHRSKKRRVEDVDDEHHGEFDANELRQHEEFTKVKNVDSVELGQYQMETWYFSPLPAEYNNCKVWPPPPNAATLNSVHTRRELLAFTYLLSVTASGNMGALACLARQGSRLCVQTLYFAEYDLSFFKTRGEMMRHLRKCKLQHPPGDEIYRCHYPGGRSVSMFEVPLTCLPPAPCLACLPVMCPIPCMHVKSPHSDCTSFQARCLSRQVRRCHMCLDLCNWVQRECNCRLKGRTLCHRLTARRRSSTARICAIWQSCSWITRPCTTMSISSSSTCCARMMIEDPTLSGKSRSAFNSCQAFHCHCFRVPGNSIAGH